MGGILRKKPETNGMARDVLKLVNKVELSRVDPIVVFRSFRLLDLWLGGGLGRIGETKTQASNGH